MSRLLAVILLVGSAVAQMPLGGITVAPAGGGGASITFAKDCGGVSTTSTSDSITGCNFTNGNTIFVGVTIFNSASTASVSMTGGGSCTQLWTENNASTAGNNYWFRCDVTAGVTAIAVSYTASVLHGTTAGEFTGSAAFTTDATVAGNKVFGTTWTANAMTTTASKYEVILAHSWNYSNDTQSGTCTTGYTAYAQAATGTGGRITVACYQIVPSTGTTYTPNGSWGASSINSMSIAISARVN